jgi:hypothetical protein
MNKEKIKNILTDIRFWILFFFILRLVGITNPPLEMGHNWRQCLTNMVARNFLEGGPHLLYPRVDMAGNNTGILGCEFPFFNYLIYLTASVFNYTHWYGRLINLAVSSWGIYYFYLLVKKITNPKTAFNSTIILLVSIWFTFSRNIMPDTFSVALVIIGLYYGYSYLTRGKGYQFILFFLFITLGMLCKIPALSWISVIGLVIFVREVPLGRRVAMVLITTLSVSIVSVWYFYWVPYLITTYRYQLYFPKGLVQGYHEIVPLLPQFLSRFYFTSLYSFVGFAFVLAGIFLLVKNGHPYLKLGVTVITITFFLFILKTGSVFPVHSYYSIPFTPVMAFLAGYGLSKIPVKFQYLVLTIISIEAIANQQNDFFLKKTELYKLSLEQTLNAHVGKKDLIVINGGDSPQEIYFAHRKGWTLRNEFMRQPTLDSLKSLGAAYLIINNKNFSEPIGYYPEIFADDHYKIYKMKP